MRISKPHDFLLITFLLLVSTFTSIPAIANSLSIQPADAPPKTIEPPFQFDQLPQSKIAYGKNDIAFAWFSDPTVRYAHRILGDPFEAAALVVETFDDQRLKLTLPRKRVFEDLEPRVIDIDQDGIDEVIVIEADKNLGASLAIYGVQNDELIKKATTPFIGTSHRWLNPLGVGDFDGDGINEIALVQTPHIGGILKLYNWHGDKLNLFAEFHGVSTHKIGSTALKLGTVVHNQKRDQMLIPNQAFDTLLLLEYSESGWKTLATLRLPAKITTELIPTKNDKQWKVELADKNFYEISIN